jgi:hypothetical protein
MTMEIAVGPAVTLADRGSPERLAPDSPDDASYHRAWRPGDEKARSGACHRSNRIGLCRRNPDRPGKIAAANNDLTSLLFPAFARIR